MNRLVRLVAGMVLLVALLTLVGAHVARPTMGSPSVTCVGVTNDADGTRMVELVTRVVGQRAFVCGANSMDLKVDGVWRTNLPLPEATKADLEHLPFDAQATGGSVHVPTKAPWRIRWEIVEARFGVEGLKERLRYPQGYRRRGGWLNVLMGHRPARYTGRTWLLESEQLPF